MSCLHTSLPEVYEPRRDLSIDEAIIKFLGAWSMALMLWLPFELLL